MASGNRAHLIHATASWLATSQQNPSCKPCHRRHPMRSKIRALGSEQIKFEKGRNKPVKYTGGAERFATVGVRHAGRCLTTMRSALYEWLQVAQFSFIARKARETLHNTV